MAAWYTGHAIETESRDLNKIGFSFILSNIAPKIKAKTTQKQTNLIYITIPNTMM